MLALSSVNLPGGELRRRSAEDELSMRRYLQEGDIISAEVRVSDSVPDPQDLHVFRPLGSISETVSSVADPGCLSRIPDPDFYPSRIPVPGSKNSNKRER